MNDSLDPNVQAIVDRYKPLISDPLSGESARKVMESHISRAQVGKKKYGVDTTRTDLTDSQWLQHLLEELMDSNVYLQRIRKNMEKSGVSHSKLVWLSELEFYLMSYAVIAQYVKDNPEETQKGD